MGPMPKKKSLTLQRVLVLLLAYIMLAVCGGVAASVLFVPGVIGANKAAKSGDSVAQGRKRGLRRD